MSFIIPQMNTVIDHIIAAPELNPPPELMLPPPQFELINASSLLTPQGVNWNRYGGQFLVLLNLYFYVSGVYCRFYMGPYTKIKWKLKLNINIYILHIFCVL